MATQSRKKKRGAKVNGKAPGDSAQTVQHVMTQPAVALDLSAPLSEAAYAMRDNGIGNVVVLEDDEICGIVTDRDIVVRAVAEGLDPSATTLGDICSRELTTITPTASVGDAVRLMPEKAIRRLPFVGEASEVLGIMSLGDLALEKDRESALANISAAPANR